MSDAVEYAARVIAEDRNGIAHGFDLIAFAQVWPFGGGAGDRDKRNTFARSVFEAAPANLRALLDLFDQHLHGFVFRAGKVRWGNDHGAGEIDFRSRDYRAGACA